MRRKRTHPAVWTRSSCLHLQIPVDIFRDLDSHNELPGSAQKIDDLGPCDIKEVIVRFGFHRLKQMQAKNRPAPPLSSWPPAPPARATQPSAPGGGKRHTLPLPILAMEDYNGIKGE